jgi:hypothetical protein
MVINLVTAKAAAESELLFNKLNSALFQFIEIVAKLRSLCFKAVYDSLASLDPKKL